MAQSPSIAKAFSSVTLVARPAPSSFVIERSQVAQWWKNLPANAGDAGSILRSSRPFGGGNGNLFQDSCLENPMDRGAWWPQSTGPQRAGQDWATEHTAVWPTSPEYSQEVAVSLKSYTLSWLLIFSLKGNDQEANIIISRTVTSYNR